MEQNKVIRHFHGHLSGVFCLKLHPTLDLLITGGRDSVARVSTHCDKYEPYLLGDKFYHSVVTIPRRCGILGQSIRFMC